MNYINELKQKSPILYYTLCFTCCWTLCFIACVISSYFKHGLMYTFMISYYILLPIATLIISALVTFNPAYGKWRLLPPVFFVFICELFFFLITSELHFAPVFSIAPALLGFLWGKYMYHKKNTVKNQ
ncbi:MAG: hypothetical protein K6G26_13060 [Lachnospiraceae bacterium]|nr:hypothetical protein [Lachnospiraceae bacterium]